jgi:hypothetical protein
MKVLWDANIGLTANGRCYDQATSRKQDIDTRTFIFKTRKTQQILQRPYIFCDHLLYGQRDGRQGASKQDIDAHIVQ